MRSSLKCDVKLRGKNVGSDAKCCSFRLKVLFVACASEVVPFAARINFPVWKKVSQDSFTP